jgi:hypothetical protein
VCSLLKEIDAAEVAGSNGEATLVDKLSADLARTEAEYAEARGFLDDGAISKALVEHLAKLEVRLAELKADLVEANRKAARPAAEAWGEARGLMGLIDTAPDPDDVRVRLRTLLRRTVEEVRVLFVARGMVRLCAAQVFFAGGAKGKGKACRSYLLLHRHATRGAVGERPEAWWARSMSDVVREGSLDLRQADHAARLEQALLELSPEDLEDGD